MAEKRCPKPIPYLLGDTVTKRCFRPKGHRGDCGYSLKPPAPLRPVVIDGRPARTIDVEAACR